MSINETDTFTVEWRIVVENHLNWEIIISLECYGTLLRPDSSVIFLLGELKSRAGFTLASGAPYTPEDRWRQAVVLGRTATLNFVMHLLTDLQLISDDDILDLVIELEEVLDERSSRCQPDIRLN